MLTFPAQFGVDIYDQIAERFGKTFRLSALSGSLDELKGIAEQKASNKKIVELTKEIIKKKEIKIIKSEKYVDNELVAWAKKGAIIATNDKELKERLKNAGAKIIFVKQKKIIEMI
ncbi:MAG: hypothetical protein JXA43_01205 [Candidatus Diapherotrites archaeon]|nr:hypothetical protein [Candidatus Diapherotrites archaeon]